jgi:hypothetical protein
VTNPVNDIVEILAVRGTVLMMGGVVV